jgi:hypothetical protein
MIKIDNLLICLVAFTYLIAPVVCGDPLNPGMLGETMDMPLPPDLVQKAVKAGVIKSASQVTGPLPSGSQPMNLGTPTVDSFSASQADAGTYITGTAGPISAGATAPQATEGDLKLSGTLSLVLQDSTTKYLTLILQQNGNDIMGKGNLTADGTVEDVMANGLISGGVVNLTVATVGRSDLYRLDLMPEGNILKGSYIIQSASGEAMQGTAAGVMPNAAANVDSVPLNPAVPAGGAGASAAVSANAGPVQLGQPGSKGSSFSSTKSISMSSTAGGSMSSSTSVSSNMGV